MAVQVIASERSESPLEALGGAPKPHLYVIDFTAAPAHALPGAGAPTIDMRRLALRRRRLNRRLRRAGEAVGWAAGSAALAVTVIAGMAGLLH